MIGSKLLPVIASKVGAESVVQKGITLTAEQLAAKARKTMLGNAMIGLDFAKLLYDELASTERYDQTRREIAETSAAADQRNLEQFKESLKSDYTRATLSGIDISSDSMQNILSARRNVLQEGNRAVEESRVAALTAATNKNRNEIIGNIIEFFAGAAVLAWLI